MKLSQLENHISEIMLKRGEEYRKNGHILALEEIKSGVYAAEVEGSDLYEVEISLNSDGLVVYSDCDCPYDMEAICKHQAAVLLELRSRLAASKPSSQSSSQTTAKGSLADQLATLEKQQLVDLLLQYAQDFKEVRQRLDLHFTEPDGKEELKLFVKLIRTYVKENSERGGFVPYRNVSRAVTGAEMVLEKAVQAQEEGSALRTVNISICVLHEMIELISACDDSDGIVGGMIEECLGLIDQTAQVVDTIPAEEKRVLFRMLLKETQFAGFEGWDEWQLSVLESAAHLADNVEARQEWEQCAAKLEANYDSKDRYGSYAREKLALLRYRLIQLHDEAEKADDYLLANLDHTEFRELAIKQAIQEQRYEEALRLAGEGEAHDAERRLPGLVIKWEKYRYEVYQSTSQHGQQRVLAEKFALSGEYAYYLQLKGLYSPQEWPDVFSRILSELEKRDSWHTESLYTRLLIEESETERLLRYVGKHLYIVTQHYSHLITKYPNEVYELFLQHIAATSLQASDRGGYKKVCQIIRELIKAGGDQQAREVVQQLKMKHPNRPAMLDELSQIKFKPTK